VSRTPVAWPTGFAWIGIGVLLCGVVPQVRATPPCMSPEYAVSYASPVWSVRILRAYLPGTSFWYWDPQGGTFENLYNHTTLGVGEDEPVTLFDRDGDRKVSANDTILIWDPDENDRTLRFGLGEDPDRLWPGTIYLEDGYRYECRGVPSDPLRDFLCIGTILLVFLGVVLSWAIWKRHRKSRRMPF